MAPPVAPFCTSADVARLHTQLLHGGEEFTSKTRPTKADVDAFIGLVSNQMLMRFRLAGYVVPFQELGTETWPTDQTEFLRLMCMLGTSGMIAGPSVANPGVRGRENNIFKQEYLENLDYIYNRQTRQAMPWRATYYSLTPAEKAVGEAAIPLTDWLSEKFDPARHYGFYDLAQKVQSIKRIFKDLDLDYDYAYSLNDLDKGLGRYASEL